MPAVPFESFTRVSSRPRDRRRTLALTALLTSVTFLAVAPAHADPRGCQRTISKASAKFARFKLAAVRKCEQAVVSGVSPGPCPDNKTTMRITQAANMFRAAIDSGCGQDASCAPGGDLGTIGWSGATCPNLSGASCNGPIGSCDDVADCLLCVSDAGVDQATAFVYHELNLSNDQMPVVRCQRGFGQTAVKLFDFQVRALQKCVDRVLTRVSPGPCPDAKNLAAIARAAEHATTKLCEVCGGPDKTCGTSDDLTELDIGFGTSCPDVTPPGGTSCAGPTETLQDIVQCIGCVMEFQSRCLVGLGSQGLAPYPPECGS